MLGGAESLAEGTYRRTPVGEMLPIYLDTTEAPVETSYRLSLTRDGWLQPWVRLRGTEVEEQTRLAGMPLFQTVNRTQRVKPGATVLAEVTDDRGEKLPALAAQQFGRGRVGALMVGDLWRWSLRRDEDHPDDMAKAWRQTIRWLVADVPRRVDLELERPAEDATSTVDLKVTVCDEHFLPMDNVTVDITVETPAKQSIALTAEPTMDQSGVYRVSFSPRESGIYRARTVVTNPDRSNLDQRQIGWATQPAISELKSVDVNQPLLQELAKQTGGRVIDVDDLDWFVADLPNRRSVVTEPWTYPIWHHWMVLSFALACFIGEWGLRRWKGLA
jgi:hypothetical protein